MKYNVEESFTFLKNDKEWIKKLLIGCGIGVIIGLLYIIPPIIALINKMFNPAFAVEIGICWLIAGVLILGLSGFCIQAAHERIFYRDAKLPEWQNFWSFVILGLKSALGSLMYYLPVIVLGLVAGAYDGISKVSGTPSTQDLGVMGTSFVVNTIYNILYFVYMFFYFAFNANFLKDFNIFSYLNYAAAYRRIKDHFVQYAILIGLIFAANIVFNIAGLMLCLTIVGIFLLPALIIYSQLVSLDFSAQFIRISENKQ